LVVLARTNNTESKEDLRKEDLDNRGKKKNVRGGGGGGKRQRRERGGAYKKKGGPIEGEQEGKEPL